MPRNSSGTMTGANGPYISGTTISSTAINARFADEEAELSDSLSRSGKGGMTAPLRGASGTVAAPAYSYTSDIGTGAYLAAAGDLRLAVGGVDALKLVSGSLGDTVSLAAAANVSTLKTVGTDSALLIQGNRASASTSPEVAIGSTAVRTAGDIFAVQNQIGVTNVLFVNYQGLLRLASQAAAIQPASVWTAITPNANWTAGGGLAYWKDATGIVRLKGFLTVGAGAANPIFTLPVGFRPSQNRYFAIADPSPAAGAVTAFVQTDGQVWMNTAITTGHLLYFDSVAFLAEA